MPYRISEFDSLALSEFIERGNVQTMGTGFSTPRLDPLPGGGFFDHYGDAETPPAIDPVSKAGVLYDTGGSDIQAQIQAFRAKLFKKGVLKITFHDSTVWWQNARLTQLSFPRPFSTRISHIPFSATWQPLDGYWKAESQTTDATTLTDADTSEDVTITNNGTRNVTDFTIRYQLETNSTTGLSITNRTTGQQLSFGTLAIAANQEVRIHFGDKWVRFLYAETNISSVSRTADGTSLSVTSTTHGMSTGQHVLVEGTTNFDNYWPSITVSTADVFTAAWPPTDTTAITSEATGTTRRYTDIYSELSTITNKRDWMVLAPGANTIRIDKSSNVANDIITFVYYDAYK